MKAIAYTSMILGAIVLLFGLLGLNVVLALIGCVGLLAGFGVNRQLGYDERLSRMESQLRIILQTQRQPRHEQSDTFQSSSGSNPNEDIAFDFLSDD